MKTLILKPNNIWEVNNSKDFDYHTQRNNAEIPLESCGTTSLVMAMKNAGWDVPHPNGIQPEDHLTKICNSSGGYVHMERVASWAVGQYRPNEVHACLKWGVDVLMGIDIDHWSTGWDIRQIFFNVLKGWGCALSTKFTGYGHIVSMPGFSSFQDLSVVDSPEELNLNMIASIIIDDPYGDWRSGYKDHHGNDDKITMIEFNKYVKGKRNHKWAHMIMPNTQ